MTSPTGSPTLKSRSRSRSPPRQPNEERRTSRSRSPRRNSPRRDRSRSRSPRRRPRGGRGGGGGFRWKDKRPRDDEGHDRNSYRPGYRRGSPPPRRGGGDRWRSDDRDPPRRPRDGANDYGRRDQGRDRDRDRGDRPRRDERKKGGAAPPRPAAAAAAAAATNQQFMVVNVNDRLGTKSAIPCMESDTVGQFKMMVAARIGRKTHEIMIKRQGERPFKDHITLGDYGVSNGVQLDLELDTGD